MDREKLEEMVSAHLDGELSTEEEAEFQTLLENSSQAQTLLESYRKQGESLSRLAAPKLPAELKKRTSEKFARRGNSRNSKIWVLGSVAACICFFWLGHTFTPSPVFDRPQFHIAESGLVTAPNPLASVLQVNSATSGGSVFESPQFGAEFVPGEARLVWDVDAGEMRGRAVRARLALDLDGDNIHDFVSESKPFELDDVEGFQTLETSFPVDRELNSQGMCRATLTLVAMNDEKNGKVLLRCDPDSSHLTLPVRRFSANV